MPELPEVETTCAGIRPYLTGQVVRDVLVRESRLRWPVDSNLAVRLRNQQIRVVTRRAKYILLVFDTGTLLIHLGMSGTLRVLPDGTPAEKHDHLDWLLANGKILRLRDPRRFGAVLWTDKPVEEHQLIAHLGPEPLSDSFSGNYLYALSRKRRQNIKQFIMNASVVVGVGNIYANEALFAAGIHPAREAGSLSRKRINNLVREVRAVLQHAIRQGGTSLRDFEKPDGNPGYFVQELAVYGRAAQPCKVCGTRLKLLRINNRATVFCYKCQK